MTTYQVHCNVLPGSTEYFKYLEAVTDGDIIDFYFNNEVIIDDLALNGSGTLDSGSIELVYPASDTSLTITSSLNVDFSSVDSYFLNTTSSNSNQWYRVPKGTKLRITFTNVTNLEDANFCIVARGV